MINEAAVTKAVGSMIFSTRDSERKFQFVFVKPVAGPYPLRSSWDLEIEM